MAFCVCAQPISFYPINTSNGLSDNNVRAIAVDSSGFLWIGTTEGLNVFDGYGITRYFKEQEPELASNHIIDLFCDSRNRIWISTQEGLSLVDSKRRFQRISLQDSITRFACASVLETQSAGIILLTSLGQFYFNTGHQRWELLDSTGSQLNYDNFMDATHFTNDQILYTTDSKVLILDYASRKIVYEQPFFAPVSACRINDSTIAVGIQTGVVQLINLHSKRVVNSYRLTGELDGKIINTNLRELRVTANGSLIASTGSAGLITINKNGAITNYTHDPVNPRSIASNNTFRVLPGKNGAVIIGTRTSGVNTYNSNNLQAGYTPIFKDKSGNLFDNYLNEIVADKHNIIWIGAYDRVIRWDRKKNESQFFYYYRENPLQGLRTVEIKALCFDKLGRLWVSALGDGIGILNEATGKFTKLVQDTSRGPALRSYYGRDMISASDGRIWVGTNGGIFAVDPVSMAATTFSDHPLLKQMAGKRVGALFEDSHGKIWMGTQDAGIYCYDKINNRLLHYTSRHGLVANTCYAFAESSKGDLYVASQNGFSIIAPDESIRSFTRLNGLRYNRCDGFLEDDKGNMWIANNKCLIKMSPGGSMEYYEGNAGLSIEGFRTASCLKTKDGELIWGSQHGINYFHPDQLRITPEQLKVNISRATLRDSAVQIGEGAAFRLPYANNGIIFHFTAINLQGSSNIIYQYILDGYDKDWQQGTDINEVRYTGLPPGNYRFKVKASADMLHWTASDNEVHITIIPPLWQRWWFIMAIGLLIAGLVFLYIDSRNKKLKRQKEELETEQAINYFASSMYEQQTVETILWDVAKNCIGRLQFEDCVVYLLDEKRKILVQKSAYGPKNVGKFEIKEPIEIPLGKGIVGSVAASGKAELVHDTSKDPRYIVDDERRYSEISVPIISDGKVLGVIDCEHSRKNFFTQKHLSILTTIASLCASKIVRVMTEKEIQEAHIRLIDTQRKMAEAEMQALRAQMNPHFIFNCLNSINRYIVKSDQATASLYLTRFARLIRLILDNSNNKNVMLSKELEALKLYIEMEALRFDNRFAYGIILDENVNPDSVEVPPLIIQPYVENAIWHGLLHLEKGGRLNVHVTMIGDGMLQCTIEDDGVGRGKARELKSKSATTRKSLGMKLTEDRISLVNKHAQLNASVEIIDLVHPDGEAAGTKVIIQIPV